MEREYRFCRFIALTTSSRPKNSSRFYRDMTSRRGRVRPMPPRPFHAGRGAGVQQFPDQAPDVRASALSAHHNCSPCHIPAIKNFHNPLLTWQLFAPIFHSLWANTRCHLTRSTAAWNSPAHRDGLVSHGIAPLAFRHRAHLRYRLRRCGVEALQNRESLLARHGLTHFETSLFDLGEEVSIVRAR
jgi:hypothetical protein